MLGVFTLLVSTQGHAEIQRDGSLGQGNLSIELTNNNYLIQQGMGQTEGNNLYHSFQHFSVERGNQAIFETGSNTSNIISRVTGGTRSDIFGTVTTDGNSPLVDFYLINPAGVLFGPSGHIDVTGAVTITTEETLQFNDGQYFYASPEGASILTSAAPSAFGILNNPTGNIDFIGNSWAEYNQLNFRAKNFNLYEGGNVVTRNESDQSNGDITIRVTENIELGKAYSDGYEDLEPINERSGTGLWALGCRDSSLCTDGGDTGDLSLTAENGNIVLDTAYVLTKVDNGVVEGDTGDITLEAKGDVVIAGTKTFSSGGVRASNVETQNFGDGSAGDIAITAENILIYDGASIQVNAFSQAQGHHAGDIDLQAAQDIDLVGLNAGGGPSIVQSIGFNNATSGSIKTESNRLLMDDGARISVNYVDSGEVNERENKGFITIKAHQELVMQGSNNYNDTGKFGTNGARITAFSLSERPSDFDSSAGITIEAPVIRMDDKAMIITNGFGLGQAGRININAPTSLSLAGSSQIISASEKTDGDDIVINTGELILNEQSEIISRVGEGEGRAGNITIKADFAAIMDDSNIDAGADQGAGGDITLAFQNYIVSGDSRISAASRFQNGAIQLTGQDLNAPQEADELIFLNQEDLLTTSCRNHEPENYLQVHYQQWLDYSPDNLFAIHSHPAEDHAKKMVQAYNYYHQGNYRESVDMLNNTVQQASTPLEKALALNSMGNSLTVFGRGQKTETVFRSAIDHATYSQQVQLRSAIENNLANYYTRKNNWSHALSTYQQAIAHYPSAQVDQTLAQLHANKTRLLAQKGTEADFLSSAQDLQALLNVLTDTDSKQQLILHLSRSYQFAIMRFHHLGDKSFDFLNILLTEVALIAQRYNDNATQSYALGQLAWFYQQQQHIHRATVLTEKALAYLESAQLIDARYRWNAQLGDLWWQQGKTSKAIKAYRLAITDMERIRHSDMNRNGSPQYYFQYTIAPVYRNLLDIVLSMASQVDDQQMAQQLRLAARSTLAKYKDQEIENHFQDECIVNYKARQQPLESVSLEAAIIYPVALDDRLEILVSIPNHNPQKNEKESHQFKQYTVDAPQIALTQKVNQFRQALKGNREDGGPFALADEKAIRHVSHELYQLLVAPYIHELQSNGVNTLVFAPDELLNDIPFNALYDGQHYLVENYAVAMAASLSVADVQEKTGRHSKILLAGVSEQVDQTLPPLPWVVPELEFIYGLYGGDVLLNQEFAMDTFQQKVTLNNYDIVHIASHAAFLGNPQDSFLLAYDGRINMNQLEQIIKATKYRADPLELLVLSACQSAEGDNISSLGLAGIGLKAGARGAIGSLWDIDDRATSELVKHFYSGLKYQHFTKAEALRQSQIAMLKSKAFNHPFYWSSMVLVNNWI